MSNLNNYRLFSIVFSIGITLGSGIGYGLSQGSSLPHQPSALAQTNTPHFGRAEYERVTPGMTVAAVEAILSRGTEVSRSETSAKFIWHNSDGSQMTALFEKGKLKSKEQDALQ